MADRPKLSIDLAMQFGSVCVDGTRVPYESLSGAVFAGDSVDSTAKDFGVTREEVLLCCWWEVEVAVQSGRQTKHEREVVERWGFWAVEVFRSLAHYPTAPDPIDPPTKKEN